MKFFFISCCGVTVTARASRPSSSPSRSPAASGQKGASPAHGRTSSARGGRERVSPSSPGRGPLSSSSSRRWVSRSSEIERGLSNHQRCVGRQTRSELGMEPIPRPPRRKSGRPMGSAASSLPYSEWTPSLGTIAEDNVVFVRRSNGDRTVSMERAVNGKSGRETSGVQSRRDTDDYGRGSPTFIPAFTPTPFLF